MNDIIEILKMLYTEPLENMTKEQVIQKYTDLMNTFIGVMIGSKLTTTEIKKLLEKK